MIRDFLGKGIATAKTASEISSLMGVDRRELARMIQVERLAGVPICATTSFPFGYFLAENAGEMRRFCGSLSRRLHEIEKTREACVAMIDQLPPES